MLHLLQPSSYHRKQGYLTFPLFKSELFNGTFMVGVSVIGIGPSMAETQAFVGSLEGDVM